MILSMNSKNILVTAIGSMSAECVIAELNASGHTVFGCDIHPAEWHAVSAACRKVLRASLATDTERYLSFLEQAVAAYGIDLLLPLTDPEIDVLDAHRERIEACGVRLCMPDHETLRIARDKYALYRFFLEEERVLAPLTVRCGADAGEVPGTMRDGGFVAKPAAGRSSEGLCYIDTPRQLEEYLRKPGYIVQERIAGPVVTVDYVRDGRTGADFSVPREELLRTKNGAGLTVRVFPDAGLQALVSLIGSRIGVNGCVNMEFIRSDKGWYLIDINPRFSAGVAFSHKAGYNMVRSHLNCHCQQEILPPVSVAAQIVTKRYVEEVITLL